MNKVITSLQNPLIKQLLLLQEKSRERRKSNLMVVEGIREISLALNAGFQLNCLLHCPDLLPQDQFHELFPSDQVSCEVIEISVDVFNRLAYRKDNGGVIASARSEPKELSGLILPEFPLILVLESVEKPGNLGAILRTADAAGISAIILCDPLTDLYNPNTIRASLGTIFTNQVALSSTDDTISWLQEKGISTFAAALTGNTGYHEANFILPSAIVMGSEAFGLSEKWLSAAGTCIKIPMNGKVDSLNVSTSAAILVFEAMRQRGFTCTSHLPA
ncbi:MAG: RNA methyltransferase [Bacteroidales bacterium]|nr:RNA methyltransferase [Bacteroidales bacterium]